MNGFALTKLKLDYVDGKSWDLDGDFCWRFRDGLAVCAKGGFRHDFNSVPWLLRRIMPKVECGEGGTIHDWLYSNNGKVDAYKDGELVQVEWTREECDRRYKEILEDTKAPAWKVNVMFSGVRLGGWKAWGDHAKRIKAENAQLSATASK